MSSNFKVEKDAETGKFKVYNKKKQSYSSRMFASKESATKMCSVYDNLGKKKTKPIVSEEDIKDIKKKTQMPKRKPATKKTERVKPKVDPKLLNPSD
tara:strand:+ start:489 stop:779 length:291 start_codon:yes stop_codon:yes gene_type:complete